MLEIIPNIWTFFSGSTNSEILLYVYIVCVFCKVTLFPPEVLWICWTLHEDILGETLDEELWTGEHVGKWCGDDEPLLEVLWFGENLFEMQDTGEILLEWHKVSLRLGDGSLFKLLVAGSLFKVLGDGSLFRETVVGDRHVVADRFWEVSKFCKKNIP
jgi:hypothetical protein